MTTRRLARWLGTLLIVGGTGVLAWALLVWRWQDPFTALYTFREQRELKDEYRDRLAAFGASVSQPRTAAALRVAIAQAARRYRRSLGRGDPVGRLRIPRLDLDMIVVNGTDDETLKRGPARHVATFLPGEGKLVYVAGHRTTYSAPFSDIDELRPGDRVIVDVPYGTFEYRIRAHRVVGSAAVQVLRSRGREEIALQACHPRFFASHRYIAYARPVRVVPRTGPAYAYSGTELTATPAGSLSS